MFNFLKNLFSSNDDFYQIESNPIQDSDFGDINPANGLPMMGSIDIEGNPYGTDSSSLDDTFNDFGSDPFS